jgi:NAD+ diphosphatase
MITFSGNPLDRAADKREDRAWLEERLRDPRTRVYVLNEGKPLVRDARLVSVADAHSPSLFLGVDADGVAAFAIESNDDRGLGTFEELRPIALLLPPEEAAVVAVAKSLFEWHRRHGYCSLCGHASTIAAAGWKRVCANCGGEHFPRVDPVVIMLPIFGDHCLVARQSVWPPGRFAPLAGFVEPGESIEEACAREIAEEASLAAVRVRYIASQPWPFPSSLMFGLLVEVASADAIPDGVELEEVRWLARDEAALMLAGNHPDLLPPNRYAIAHHLITTWIER